MDTPSPEIYTLSLHDALPIWSGRRHRKRLRTGQLRLHDAFIPLCSIDHEFGDFTSSVPPDFVHVDHKKRSEEHTSELQSPMYLVCRLLLEKKKTIYYNIYTLV